MAERKAQPEEEEARAAKENIPEGQVIYRAVRQDGDHSLQQSSANLAWSALAAGISMGFSLAAEGMLRAHLPEAGWTPLITKLGYTVGFVVVILGRQQVFTEQTLTAMLPLFSRDRPNGFVRNVVRLWSVVVIANILGAALFAAGAAWTPAFSPEVQDAFLRIGHEALEPGSGAIFVRSIYAGFLIATMVWLLPGAGPSRLWIVILLSYIVGLGGLAHVVAGASEALFVVFKGERPISDFLVGYLVPCFVGNSIGGVSLVAALAHAQHAPDESR